MHGGANTAASQIPNEHFRIINFMQLEKLIACCHRLASPLHTSLTITNTHTHSCTKRCFMEDQGCQCELHLQLLCKHI